MSLRNPSTEAIDAGILLNALTALREGDFSVRLPVGETGIKGKINDTLNEIFKLNARMAGELQRINHSVGKEGKQVVSIAVEGNSHVVENVG